MLRSMKRQGDSWGGGRNEEESMNWKKGYDSMNCTDLLNFKAGRHKTAMTLCVVGPLT